MRINWISHTKSESNLYVYLKAKKLVLKTHHFLVNFFLWICVRMLWVLKGYFVFGIKALRYTLKTVYILINWTNMYYCFRQLPIIWWAMGTTKHWTPSRKRLICREKLIKNTKDFWRKNGPQWLDYRKRCVK